MTQASKGRSAVTNGRKPFLTQASRKTPEYRRLRDLLSQMFKDRGGIENISVELQAACRVYAGLCVQYEVMLGQLAAGEVIDAFAHTSMASAVERGRRSLVAAEPKPKRAAVRGRVVATIPGAPAPLAGDPS